MAAKDLETIAVGDTVVFHDPTGIAHDALVTAVWNRDPGCINVVIVSGDEGKTDPYGRQIERHTSVAHATPNWVHGMYFRFDHEEPLPYKAPVAV